MLDPVLSADAVRDALHKDARTESDDRHHAQAARYSPGDVNYLHPVMQDPRNRGVDEPGDRVPAEAGMRA